MRFASQNERFASQNERFALGLRGDDSRLRARRPSPRGGFFEKSLDLFTGSPGGHVPVSYYLKLDEHLKIDVV